MNSIISACGNDCSVCPRYYTNSDKKLLRTAELWHQIGYRDRVVSIDEIRCDGCKPENWCRYEIIKCVTSNEIANCGQCETYPCKKINETFDKTMTFESNCKKYCTNQEFEIMKKAFFEKRENLDIEQNKK